MSKQGKELYEFGPFRTDPRERLLTRDGEALSLTPKVFETLLVLVRNSGHLMLKDELMKAVWPDSFVEEVNLSQNISVLRKTLGDTAQGSRYIVTVPGLGYRFAQKVRVVDEDEIEGEEETLVVESHRRARVVAETRLSVDKDRHPKQDASSALHTSLAGQAGSPVRSLAVLALENLSKDAAQEYFADGLTDELITRLARIPELRVISRTSAMRYKGTGKSIPEIGRELGVEAIIEGTVERSEERVRLRVQLIEAATDRSLWAESYDRPLTDVLTLESEFAQHVAARLHLSIIHPTGTPPPDRALNPAVVDRYMKGLHFFNQRGHEGLVKAVQAFQECIAADADYASPYAALARCYVLFCGEMAAPLQYLEQAQTAASKALSLDPALPEAHSVLAFLRWHDFKFADAEREHRLAVSLGPNHGATHHWYAIFLMAAGRYEEALHEIDLARALDPGSLMTRATRFLILWYTARQDEALREIAELIETGPGFPDGFLFRGVCLMWQGRSEEGLADIERAKGLQDSSRYLAWLGWGTAVAGDPTRARAILSALKTLRQKQYVNPWFLALVCLGLDERDEMFEWLDVAYQDRCTELFTLCCTPIYAPVRRDPRFEELAIRIGFPQVAARLIR